MTRITKREMKQTMEGQERMREAMLLAHMKELWNVPKENQMNRRTYLLLAFGPGRAL